MNKLHRYLAVLGFLMALQVAKADLVVNGGFETGDFTGWAQGGDPSYTSVQHVVHSGQWAAELGPINPGTLSQTLATMIGATYNLVFWLENDYSSSPQQNHFTAQVNGATAYSATNIPGNAAPGLISPSDFVAHSFSFKATSSSTPLLFTFDNQTVFFHLDDVSVNPVPEPSTLLLIALGGIGTAFWMRRVKKNSTLPV